MYYQLKSNILFRNYFSFGYLTDNRDFSYKKCDNNPVIGDRIVSESGALFLSVLSQTPKEIGALVSEITKHIPDVGYNIIYNDAVEFYNELVEEGFLISGVTPEECAQNDIIEVKKGVLHLKNNVFNVGKKKDSYIETQDFFKIYFGDRLLLKSLHIDITSFCNERCIHCFIPHNRKNHHMDMGLFNKILAESIEMKVLNFTLTGGEPMLHPCFLDIIKKCRKENISLNILSNLTLVSKEILLELIDNPLINIQTSLYSMNPDIHDGITQLEGSFDLTKNTIITLVKNNVNLQICCPILNQNFESYKDVIEWAKTMNVNVSSDYMLIGKYDANSDNLSCRLVHDKVAEVIYSSVSLLEKEVEENKLLSLEDPICSVCRYSLCISEKGFVYPCAGWQNFVVGDLRVSSLSDIWYKSDSVNYLRSLKLKDFSDCSYCNKRFYCNICMVRNANENRDHNPKKVSQYYCDIADLKKRIYEEYAFHKERS